MKKCKRQLREVTERHWRECAEIAAYDDELRRTRAALAEQKALTRELYGMLVRVMQRPLEACKLCARRDAECSADGQGCSPVIRLNK